MSELSLDQHADELIETGYTVVHDVLPPHEIKATQQAIDECLAQERDIATNYGLQDADLQMSFNVQGKHPHFFWTSSALSQTCPDRPAHPRP